MKKIILSLFSLLLSVSTQARVSIDFNVQWYPEILVGNGHSKSPIQPPTVYIEDYTLSFVTGHPDYVLNIKDEDGDTVYATTVYSAQTQVTLPSTLSGNYEIELVMGYWLFTGWINGMD